MHMKKISFGLLVTALALGGCDDAEEAPAAAATPSAPSTPEEPVVEPEPTEPTRMVSGTALERTAGEAFSFHLTNHGDQEVTRMQAWVYYYNAEGETVDRYPHSFFATIAPGASVDQELGRDEEDFEEGTVTADVEISSVRYADRTEWANENLVQGTRDRAVGGLSHEALSVLTGEPILGTWSGEYGDDNKPTFTLHNTTDQPLDPRVAWIYYYAEDGNDLGRDVINMRGEPIAPDGDFPLEAGKTQDELPEGTHAIEIYVSRFERADGTTWENRNLYPNSGREMRNPPEAPAAAPAE